MSCSNKSGPTDQWGFVSGLRGRELRTPEMLKAVMSTAYVCCGAFQQHLVWEMGFLAFSYSCECSPRSLVLCIHPHTSSSSVSTAFFTIDTSNKCKNVQYFVMCQWKMKFLCPLIYPKIARLDQPEFFQALMLRMKKREPRIQNLCPVVIKDILFSIQTKRHPYYAGLFLEIF